MCIINRRFLNTQRRVCAVVCLQWQILQSLSQDDSLDGPVNAYDPKATSA